MKVMKGRNPMMDLVALTELGEASAHEKAIYGGKVVVIACRAGDGNRLVKTCVW